jgi:glycosyltransferase involved in cell wall biosynthesis
MRIALITNWALPIGGSQLYACELARQLADRHEVLVLSGAPELHLDPARCSRIPHLRPLHPAEPVVSKVVWHLRDQWRPSVHRVLKRELALFAPDVVHTQEPQGLSAAVFSAVAAARARHVHTAHDLNLLCARTAMTRDGQFCGGNCAPCLLQRGVRRTLAARWLHRLIAPSDYVGQKHVAFGVAPPERIVTIRQPASAATGRARRVDPPAFSIGFMGALAQHKGVLTLLEAFRLAPAEWRLEIAGSGVLEPHVRAAAALDPRITFRGYLTGLSKDAFFDSLDLLVIPSECEENAPRVAVEAVVRGVPVAVSDRGGLPETPEAVVFPAADARGLAAALLSLARKPEWLAAASERLISVRQDFLWPRHVERLEAVYTAVQADSEPQAGVRDLR